jgi:hypothetical protein
MVRQPENRQVECEERCEMSLFLAMKEKKRRKRNF